MAPHSKQTIADLAARLSRLSEPDHDNDADSFDMDEDEEAPLSDLERRALRDASPDVRRRILPRISDMPENIKPSANISAPPTRVQAAPASNQGKNPPIQLRSTPPVTSAPVNPADLDPQHRERLVKLLMDVNDRLRRSETERDLLWRELETTRRLVDDINDKSTRFDKQSQLLQTNLIRRDKLAEELIRRNQDIQNQQKILAGQVEDAVGRTQALESRIDLTDTTSTSLLVKINDLLGDSVKLSRRLDQVTYDKTRLLRKIEGVEDTLLQTQDTLRARALVLLTDQTTASRTRLPQSDAMAAQADPDTQEPWINRLANVAHQMTQRPVLLIAAFVALGLLVGWMLSGVQWPQSGTLSSLIPSRNAPSAPVPAMTQAQLWQVMRAEEAAEAGKVSTLVAPLITPDPTLPAEVKGMERQAFTGAAEAQHDLAALYTAGHSGVSQDFGRAIDWFTLAARRGVANARYNLGVLYQNGSGGTPDATKAVQYYRSAAFLGHPEALYNLGILALAGEGMTASSQRAALYFNRAASLGLVEAAYSLGGMMEKSGSQAGQDTAIFWYKLAADAGSPDAVAALDALANRLSLKSSDIMTRYNQIAPQYPEAAAALGPQAVRNATPAAAPVVAQKPPPIRVASPEAPVTVTDQSVAIVAQIQEQLARQNLYIGEADGQVSVPLAEAITTYQRQNNLDIDGRPSEDLLVHMLAREFSLGVDPAKTLAQ
ncbi:MAG: peptidoglycan-binding protein [Pseudomonadota bacterium]